MIWAKVVSWPWPWVWTPIRASTLPVGWTRISHAVEHLDAEDVEVVRRPGADDLGEAADADAHQLAALARFSSLLLAQAGVVDHVHAPSGARRVVARVVLPAGRGLVRELLGLDEVLHPELGRVLADVVGQDVDHPLDGVDGLGHAERAAVGDAAGRLVGVDAVDLDERVRGSRSEPVMTLNRPAGNFDGSAAASV